MFTLLLGRVVRYMVLNPVTSTWVSRIGQVVATWVADGKLMVSVSDLDGGLNYLRTFDCTQVALVKEPPTATGEDSDAHTS